MSAPSLATAGAETTLTLERQMETEHDEGLDRVAGTARWTAAERARESERSDRLFEDPLAHALAGDAGRALAEGMRGDPPAENPGFAVRTRYYDDLLTDAVAVRGVADQVVVVAAGMDSRAFRLPVPGATQWYELDRPGLLRLKQRLLDEAGAVPRCVRRAVGVDLTTDWRTPLLEAGFEPSGPTVWLVEGLIFYLEPPDVHRLLDELSALAALSAPGSELLIDTVGESMLHHTHLAAQHERMARAGIVWRFGTDRPEDDLLAPRGWQATVSTYGEVGQRLGRWPYPPQPRGTPGVPQSFLIHAVRVDDVG